MALADIQGIIDKYGGSGKQVILKAEIVDIGEAILELSPNTVAPNIKWIDATQIQVPAAADSPAAVNLCGFPNILHPRQFVTGGLTDGLMRTNTTGTSFDFDTSATLWGTEKSSQWYMLYAIAADGVSTFTLKAMPLFRFSSQASQVITLRNCLNSANIGYGFTTDELVGGKIYILSGASAGEMRSITANNNNNTTGGTITYSGSALTMSQGDWFVVLPPGTNFRFVGTFVNNSSGNIPEFVKRGRMVFWASSQRPAYYHDSASACLDVCPLANKVMYDPGSYGTMAIEFWYVTSASLISASTTYWYEYTSGLWLG